MDASYAPDSSKPLSVNPPSESPLTGDKSLWEEFIPRLTSEYVKKQIEGQYREQPYEPQPKELVSQSADLQSQRDNSHRTYLSFGNNGTTATVTEWGQHMQISQYLNHGPSAFYAIDHEDTSEPFQMQKRARDIQKLIENSQGFGPDILMPGNTNDWSISTHWLRNRWPRVVIKDDNNWEAVVQWYIQGNVVIQSIVCQNYRDDPLNLWCTTNLNVRIRQLDFANDSHSFNRGEELHAEGAGPGGYGFVRIQRLPPKVTESEQNSDPDAVAAVIGLFVNGRPMTLEDYETEFSNFDVPAKEKFRLIVGYKLVPLKIQHGKETWQSLVLKSGDVDIEQFLLDSAPKDDILQDLLLSDQEFYIRRYVEHILSVCMISIPSVSEVVPDSGPLAVDELGLQSSKTNDESGARQVALTCGDMYGHRICVSASFFAYKFLLEVARILPENHPVKVRIKRDCFAHLVWVFERARKKDLPNFVRNLYVNGNVIPDSSTLPPNGLTDTPFQILKAYEYWKVFPDSKSEIQRFLEIDDTGMKWIKNLDETSKGDAFVWRHAQRAGLDYFRFNDHYWIWSAIVAINDILDWDTWTKKQGKRMTSEDWQKEKLSLARKFRPDRVKDEILRRFTIVYDVTKKRTLAVTRSARETRFEFHSRDTVLFYDIANSKMLSPDEPRWLSTLQIQKTFLLNQESDFYNPLRHGLAILMAKEGVSISGSEVFTVRDQATKALTTAITSNGLFIFPLQEDKDGNAKHPDYLANIFFEVPFILLSLKNESKQSSTEQEMNEKGSLTNVNQTAESSNRIISVESGTVPFNDQVDLKNVVDVKEEWLYNRPYFLEWEMPTTEIISEQVASLKSSKGFSELQQTTGSREIYDVLTQCASCSQQPTFEPKGNSKGCQALIDIGKRNIRQSVLTFTTIRDIWGRLHKRRAAHEAKKRLIWFGTPSLDSALMCYLSSPDIQKPVVRQFFNRHANGANFFGDRTSRVLNRWVTEFHCSFLQLEIGTPGSDDQERSKAENPILILFPGINLDRKNIHGWLSKTSAGFRFDGDFFDRFWTCFYTESYRNVRYVKHSDTNQVSGHDITVNDFLSKENLGKIFSHGIDHVWKQRKVLELLLFFRILNKAYQNGSIILQHIQSGLNKVQSEIDEITQRSSSRIDSFFATTDLFDTRAELFFGSLAKWRELDTVLDMVDNHLEAILSNIKKWNTREQDREPEKPRWTNKDERKYRDAINAALHLCQRVEQGLENQKRYVTTLKRLLEKRRSEAQNNYNRDMSDRSYRQSVNITYFTYSTVIFLPLGFAASIYSMQAAPPTDVLQHMVICAIVTFVVLIILIFALPRCLRIMRKVKTALFSSHESNPRPPIVVELGPESNGLSYSGFMDENITLWDKVKKLFTKNEGKSGELDV